MGDGNGKYQNDEMCFSIETVDRVHAMDEKLSMLHPMLMAEIPKMQLLLSTMATSMNVMSAAALSMATTNDKAEARYERMDLRLQEVNDRASGKGMMPITSHYMTMFGTVLIAVLVILYVNKQTLDASLTSIKISGEKIQQTVKEEVQKIEVNK